MAGPLAEEGFSHTSFLISKTTVNDFSWFVLFPVHSAHLSMSREQVRKQESDAASPSCSDSHCSRAELLNFGTIDIWDQITLCFGGDPTYRRMFSSILGLYTLDASSTFRILTNKNVWRDMVKCPLGGGGKITPG